MNAYSRLNARGYRLVKQSPCYEEWVNAYRGYKLVVSLKEQWYYFHDYIYGGVVIVTPKMHDTVTQYLKEKDMLDCSSIQNRREMLGISRRSIALACSVSESTVKNFEMGVPINIESEEKLNNYFNKRGII